MRLRYGFNEVDGWWDIGLGPHRERIRHHHRLMGTQVVRVFVFDKPVPDPVTQWDLFAAYVQAVLDMGAVPMITFAKYHPPHDDPRNLRTYVARCADVVWGCLEQWGGERVRDWYWCVWNEPNNYHVGGAPELPAVPAHLRGGGPYGAPACWSRTSPGGRRASAGRRCAGSRPTGSTGCRGSSTRSTRRSSASSPGTTTATGDRRCPAPPSASTSRATRRRRTGRRTDALLMAQTPQYETRARAVARIIGERDIENVCGELNTVVHHNHAFVGGLNQNAFGAAYYASALIHLMRGGADLEMRWTATAHDDAYGVMTREGEPTPACLAKELFAQHVRYGDWVSFPDRRPDNPDLDAVVSWSDDRPSQRRVRQHRGPAAHLGRCGLGPGADGLPGGAAARRGHRRPGRARAVRRDGPPGRLRRRRRVDGAERRDCVG